MPSRENTNVNGEPRTKENGLLSSTPAPESQQQQQQLDEQQQRDDLTESFPTYMQPEKLQYLGVHVAEIRIRLHLMGDKK